MKNTEKVTFFGLFFFFFFKYALPASFFFVCHAFASSGTFYFNPVSSRLETVTSQNICQSQIKLRDFSLFLSHRYVDTSCVTSTRSLFGFSLFLPLLEEPRERGRQGGSEGIKAETDSGSSRRPAGCALLLNLPHLKAFKGNTLTAYFSSFLHPSIYPSIALTRRPSLLS